MPEITPGPWDPYSEQPYKLPRTDKPRHRRENLVEYARTLGTALCLTPLVAWHYARPRRLSRSPDPRDFVGLSVSPNAAFNTAIVDLVEELGVRQLLLRVPGWDLRDLPARVRFAEQFSDKGWVINILQNRDCVRDPQRWQRHCEQIFAAFRHLCRHFQVGNAINRSKWGCAHAGDYLRLTEAAEEARRSFPDIELLGSSVIDFEPLVTLRTLVNFRRFSLQHTAAQLYVNRRGSAFGRQYGIFDLQRKIRLVHAITTLSNRSESSLWITETNWPLLDTRPYTPNSGHPRSTVDEATQARYLKQYYQVAWHSRLVRRVYWWQLLNPGYGLVDFRGGKLRKHPSWFALKDMIDGEIRETPRP